MLSLYLHIPFCASKCAYCSFNSIPVDSSNTLIDSYVEVLKKEINHYSEILVDKELKTLYIWWGTPSRIWVERIIDIIEHITENFDLENLAELSIELNPYPEEEVLSFVKTLNKRYPKISRLRYSFGIQSFDDDILKMTWRAYTFWGIVEFLRALVQLKQDNNVFNFDFIAFGTFQVSKNGFKQLWHEFKREFFQKFLDSGYVDSISLYTLEGLKNTWDRKEGLDGLWSIPSNPSIPSIQSVWHWTDDEIMEEFLILKDMVENAGFGRYEISNFARASKASIHNMVYRNMEPYIGLWLSAASFFGNKRWTNIANIKQYLEGNWIDKKEVHVLNASDILIEEFFLRLRTREWIADISKFIPLLVPNYESLLEIYTKEGLLVCDWSKLQLTDDGMNVYNSIITDLLQKI